MGYSYKINENRIVYVSSQSHFHMSALGFLSNLGYMKTMSCRTMQVIKTQRMLLCMLNMYIQTIASFPLVCLSPKLIQVCSVSLKNVNAQRQMAL